MKTRARPRELAGGGWLQATLHRRSVPAGYCAGHAGEPHATADEANACWRKYLVEQTLRLDGRTAAPGKCLAPSGCDTLTDRVPVINGYPRWPLCDEHRTAEVVAELWNAPRPLVPHFPLHPPRERPLRGLHACPEVRSCRTWPVSPATRTCRNSPGLSPRRPQA